MSDENKNANEITNETVNAEENQEIKFYYSRDDRLKRASAEIRAMNLPMERPKFFKTLLGNRGNVMILMSILIICMMYYFGNRFMGSSETELTLGNNRIAASITEEGGILFLSVQKTYRKDAYAYTGAVDIAVSPASPGAGESPQVLAHRIYFSLNSPENYIISLPFDSEIARFVVMFQTENEAAVRTIGKSE